jgi:chaperonin GroES
MTNQQDQADPTMVESDDDGGLEAALANVQYRSARLGITPSNRPRVRPVPLYDRVIVRQDEAQATVGGGLLAVADNQKERPQEGEVLYVGTGKVLESGTEIPMKVKVGDRVAFGKFSGADLVINNDVLKILREDEIMVVLVPEETNS